MSKGANCPGKPRLRAFALTDNMALLSAWANDSAYKDVFAEQLEGLLEPEDVVIAISGSGNSLNVIEGVRKASEMGAITVALTGSGGGVLSDLVDIAVVVPSCSMEQIEDVHLILSHVITRSLRGTP